MGEKSNAFLIETKEDDRNSKNGVLTETLNSHTSEKFSSTDLFKVVKFESVTERERNILKLSIGGRSPTKMPTQLIHLADDDDSGVYIHNYDNFFLKFR